MDSFLSSLTKVDDAASETFELFAVQHEDGVDLGMLAPEDATIDITIGRQDFCITQSPGVLQSKQQHGTTGAVLWQSSVRFAKWLAQPLNPLVEALDDNDTRVLELGAGATGLITCVLAATLKSGARIIASDMSYSIRLLRENIEANHSARQRNRVKGKPQPATLVDVVEFDWEQHDAKALLRGLACADGVDLVMACDCVYNYALIRPFLDTCADVCQLRQSGPQTACVVVQQLRQPDVCEEWLTAALEKFDVWRLPKVTAGRELSEEAGFVVHLLMLR